MFPCLTDSGSLVITRISVRYAVMLLWICVAMTVDAGVCFLGAQDGVMI